MPSKYSSKIPLIIIIILTAITFYILISFVYDQPFYKNTKINNYGKEKITIGWIGPLTGPVSFLGIENARSIEMAVEDYNKSKSKDAPRIEVIFKDDQYISALTAEQYDTLMKESHPEIFIINTYDGMKVLSDKIYNDNVIAINPIDNDNEISLLNKNTFFIAKKTEELGGIYARHLQEEKFEKAFILSYNDDKFMPTLSQSVRLAFNDRGGDAVIKYYSSNTTDFKDLLHNSNEQFPAYLFFGYSEIGNAIKQAKELGIDAAFYTANISMTETAGDAMEGVEFAHFTEIDGNVEKAEAMISKYKKKYDAEPVHTWTILQSYDAIKMTLLALDRTEKQEGDFTANLRTQLLRIDYYQGVSGNLEMHPDGTVTGINWNIYTYKNKKINRF